MGIFRQFPYSNFHEMNMDEILKIVKTMSEEWERTKEEWASYKEFIDNYFATLDVSEEVLNALRVFAEDGTLNEIIDPVIAEAVTDWLDEHVTPTTPIIDSSLTISGAGADAKTVGDLFNVTLKVETPNTNNANELDTGIIQITTDQLSGWTNIPETTTGIFVITTNDSVGSIQYACTFTNYISPSSWIRVKSANIWSEWYKEADPALLEKIMKVEAPNTYDANELDTGIISIATNALNLWSNIPVTNSGVIIVTSELNDSTAIQQVYNFANNFYPHNWVRVKSSGIWSSWYINDNSFIMGKNITAEADANDFEPGSIYTTTNNTAKIANVPFTRVASIIKTYALYGNQNQKVQTFESWGNNYYGIFAVRNNQGNSWSEWSIVRDNTPNSHNGFTVIGDSLASGYISTGPGTGNTYYNLSWCAFLASLYNCKFYISGASGQSTTDWLDSITYGYNGVFQRFPKTPIYILALGTNDANQSTPVTTFKNNYRQIISAIKAKQPNAIIICLNIWRTAEPFATYHTYITELMGEYTANDNVFGIDITSEVNSTPISNHLYNGHYDAVGYKLIADEINTKILGIFNTHPDKCRSAFADMIKTPVNAGMGYPYPY